VVVAALQLPDEALERGAARAPEAEQRPDAAVAGQVADAAWLRAPTCCAA